MGNLKTVTSKPGAASSRELPPKGKEQRFPSSSDLWPEATPAKSTGDDLLQGKCLPTPRDQLLYLQALFPYAAYDELMAVITETDGPDEAAQQAYEALNPNYTGYLYLKEQADTMNNAKSTRAQRATAFSGLREALEERAADAFCPGTFSNLSQLQEYQETVGLFAVDTTDWDRAMLLPPRDVAEMACMDLPLRGEPSSSSSSHCSGATGTGKGSVERAKQQLLSLALNGSNLRFMDSCNFRPHARSNDMVPLSPQRSPEKRDANLHNGCKTPVMGGDAHECWQQHPNPGDQEEMSVLYLQDSDPECLAPIIAWAPEAIRVGPAEALRQQEGALRVFDEATFFTDPLLALQSSSKLLQTPLMTKATASPGNVAAMTNHSAEAHRGNIGDRVNLYPLLTVSSIPSPHSATERHEPIDSPSASLPFIEEGAGEQETSEAERFGRRTEFEDVDVEANEREDCVVGRDRSKGTGNCPSIHEECIPVVLGLHNPMQIPIPSESDRRTDRGGTRRFTAEYCTDYMSTGYNDVSNHLVKPSSLRETAVEKLKTRKRRPLTSSDRLRQRMRRLKPVGNLIFRENADSSPTIAGTEHTCGADDGRPTPAASHCTFIAGSALEKTPCSAEDIYTDPSSGTQRADWTTRGSRGNERATPASGNSSHVHGSAAAAATTGPPSSLACESRDQAHGQAVTIPAAHLGCSSLDPAAYLNSEEERWSGIVEMLRPFEDIFGAKFRCELVRCVHNNCCSIRPLLTEILRRLLHVVHTVAVGKEVSEGFAEEPMDLPVFGSILLSTSPVKLQELVFREEKCELNFCEEGTRLKVKLHIKEVKFEPIQFAYIDEAGAARQNRVAQQARRKMLQPRSRAAEWAQRHNSQEKYKRGITRGTANISAANVKLKGIVYIWLMASGKVHLASQDTKVSIGSLRVSTDVPKLNFLFTVGSPLLKLVVERMLLDAVNGLHSF